MAGDALLTVQPLRVGSHGPKMWSAIAISLGVMSTPWIFIFSKSDDGMYPSRACIIRAKVARCLSALVYIDDLSSGVPGTLLSVAL